MPPQHGSWLEQEEYVIQARTRVVGNVAKLRDQDDKRQFLPGGHAEPTGVFPLQDSNVLAEQEQFQVLRMSDLRVRVTRSSRKDRHDARTEKNIARWRLHVACQALP